MSKTERALESEALDRDEVLADGHTDGVERADGDGAVVFDAEAGERDWPLAPTDEARRPTPPDDEVETEQVAEHDVGVARPDDAGDTDAGTDAVPHAAEHADGDDESGPMPIPGDPLVAGVPQARVAPPSDDDSGAWESPAEGSAHEVTAEPAPGSNGDRPPDGDEGTKGFVAPEPSEDVLEELRRADVDGPTVIMAPQDDTTAARRRPRRLPEYDPAPIPVPTKIPRVLGRKPRVRKVTRVVRSVDPWSVFKIAMVASLVLYVIVLTSGVLLWNVAYATGTIDNVERFFESFGWSSFEFNGGEIFHAAWIGGLFAAVGLTGLAVLGAALFNLITDLVGGVRLTVLEEEVVETRISPMRRFVVRRSAPQVPAVENDESGPLIRETIVDDSGAIIRRTR